MPLTNVTLATPLVTGLGVTADGDVVQPDIDNRVVLNDVLVRVNDVDISDLCTHVSFQSSTDERDVTTYGSRNRVRRLGAIYRIEVTLDLILGTDEATTLVPTSEFLPTSQQLLTGAAADVWTGIQFDQLFDSDLPTRVEISPRRFPVPPIDGNPLFEVPCRITKWTRLVGGVGEPAAASLTLVGTAAVGVSRGVKPIVTPPPVSTTKIIVLSTAVEVSTVPGLARKIAVGQSLESEAPQTIGRRGVIASAIETSQAIAIAPRKTRAVGQATETSTTQAVTIRKTRAVVQVSDTETATQFSVRGTLGRATAVETAQAIVRRKRRAVVAAVDTEQSVAITRGALATTLYPDDTLYPADRNVPSGALYPGGGLYPGGSALYPAFFLTPTVIPVGQAVDLDIANALVVAKSGVARPRAGFPFPITPAPPPPAIPPFDPVFAVAGGPGRNNQPAFQYAPLPTDVAIDTNVNQAAFQAELNSRAQASRSINSQDFTTRRIVVANNQTLEPVLLWRADWGGGFAGTNYPPFALNADQICRAGFPLPTNYAPLTTSDKGLVLLQPDYQAPQWTTLPVPLTGRMFEGWIVEPNPAYNPTQPKVWPNYAWRCGWPGRAGGLNIYPGHFIDWTTNAPQASWPYTGYDGANPANPDSTFQQITLGASASGIALADSEILVEDLDRNINGGQWGLGHCVGLNVPTVGGFRWPAQRSDATSASTYPIYYGMRLCLPANYVIPSNLHPVCRALVQNCIINDDPTRPGYGLIVHEQTGTSVLFKAQPGAEAYWAGVTPDVVLNGFPWNQLQVIQAGQDAAPVPISAPTAGPANTGAPFTAGPVIVGQTTGLYRGAWTGTAPITFTFKWQGSPDGVTWTDRAGATSQRYLSTAADIGQVLRGVVTATNVDGSVTVATVPTTAVVAGTAPFMRDSFTGTDGTTVATHIGEIGATWTTHPVNSGNTAEVIQANRAMGPTATGFNVLYTSAVPPSADYDVTGLVNELVDNNASYLSVVGRVSTTVDSMYLLRYESSTNVCSLVKVVSGVATVLASVSLTARAAITLRMVGNQISGIVDDQLVLGPVTDASLTTAGRVGLRHGPPNSTTAGVHLDNIEAVAVASASGTTPTSAQSSLSILSTSGVGDITVTFNKPYQVGQFANGDYFVLPDPTLGTVVVSAMTPTYTTGRHGYAVNPKATAFNVSNSFDNRGTDDSAFVVPPALPLSLTSNQSLIKVASMTTQTSFSWIDNAAVVTVLATAPPVGTMRPAAFGTDKRLISSTAISGSLFPNLSAAAVPNRLTYAQCIARCEPFRNDYHPGPSWGYYRSSASAVPGGLTWGGDVLKSDIELLCSLCLNHLTATEKRDIAIRYAQHGIDTWGVSVPATGGGAGFLRGGGANGAGHLLSLSFAAWLTNDAALQGFLDNASEATWNPAGGAGIGAAAFLYWETASFYRSSVTSQALWGKKWETFIGDSEAGYWSDLNVPAGVGGVNNATLRDPYERIDGGPVPGGSYQDTVSHQIMGLAALMDVMTGFQAAWTSLVQNDAVLREYGHRWELNGIRTAPDPVAPKTALGSYGVNYGPNPQTGTGGPGYDGTGVNGYIGGSGRAPSLNNTGAHGGNRFSQLTDDFVTAYSTG